MTCPGPRNAITDVPGLLVGNAEDHALKSGVTVLTAETPFLAGVDVRGGAPGTRETDLLAPGRLVETVDALVLSGGSAFGLDAASGVCDALRDSGRGYPAGTARVPIVPAAILFDLMNGGDKAWRTNPYRALGEAALAAAGLDFAQGSTGAGTGALTANLKGGLGSASLVLESGVTVGALVAVNALGRATLPDGRHFLAGPLEIDDEFGGLGPGAERLSLIGPGYLKGLDPEPGTNTTIAIVATDAALDKAAATRMAAAAHDGLARALYPAHTPFDGDLVFGVSTGRVPLDGDAFTARLLIEHAAAHCLARAVARGLHAARPMSGDVLPCWSQPRGSIS